MGTLGADFLRRLDTDRFRTIWRNGSQSGMEAYAVTARPPAVIDVLRAFGERMVVGCGLATNTCCFYTYRDRQQAGFDVIVAGDASAGIDIPAAGPFQAKAKESVLGIHYRSVGEMISGAPAR